MLNQRNEVLEEVRDHFQKQFRKRNTRSTNLPEQWEEAYKPLRKVDTKIYDSLENEVSEEEWTEAFRRTKSKSALGLSGISYLLIKKVEPIVQKVFRYLANMCIGEGKIPVKWKLSQLYLIPKGEDWNFDLSNVHLIVLIETFYKTVVRVLTQRLDKIMVEHNILEGPNYADLSGNSTASLVHIMNNILEDARQKNNELWILFQDMRKAFDSVGLEMLKKSLERIKLPKNAVSFILSLYEKRKIKVITNFGLTKEFEAKDGLDQGEVISPLAWRIFYDPLLCTVQKTKNLGYEMTTKWPTDITYNLTKELSHRQAVLAYADDTTWIAKSKKELQDIINISNEFYEINDIEINSKKSELIAINVNKKCKGEDQLAIIIGKSQSKVYAKKETDLARHLGV